MEKADCIPIGTTIRLISVPALCHGTGLDPDEAVRWLASLGVPVTRPPNSSAYFNLFTLELALLKALNPPGFSWRHLIKELATAYGLLEKRMLMERAAAAGRRLEIMTKFKKPLVKRRKRR